MTSLLADYWQQGALALLIGALGWLVRAFFRQRSEIAEKERTLKQSAADLAEQQKAFDAERARARQTVKQMLEHAVEAQRRKDEVEAQAAAQIENLPKTFEEARREADALVERAKRAANILSIVDEEMKK